jgi:hypothetical protein
LFDERGLQAIHGKLEIQQLAVPQALVQSLMTLKLFAPGAAYPSIGPSDQLEVPQLAVLFSFSEMGLACKGAYEAEGLPVAATSESGPVLLSDGHVRANYLICALVPEKAENVYPTRARLMRGLPATLPRL